MGEKIAWGRVGRTGQKKEKGMHKKRWVLYLRLCFSWEGLSGLPNANAKSPRFSCAISQIAALPPVVALNRSSKSQIAARYAAFWHAISQIALASFLLCPKSQRFKSQRLQDANATKSQTLAFYKSQRFSATKGKGGNAEKSKFQNRMPPLHSMKSTSLH